MTDTNSVGARKVVGTFLGEDQAAHWSRAVLRIWGFLFVGFVFLFVWLPSGARPARSRIFLWMVAYTAYVLCLEILSRKAKRLYESKPFQLFRIHFNLAMTTTLMLVAPPTTSGYLWFFFSLPILAVLLYFGRPVLLLVILVEVYTSILMVLFAQGWPTSLDLAAMVAKGAILGLLAAVLCFFVHFFPRLREEGSLLKAATTLIQVLDQKDLCQLLADAAKAGVPTADAAVVHLLGGEDNRTLIPLGSSHLDLTTLGRTPMKIGFGIAGYAIQNHETISVPDVNEDDRYLALSPSFTPFKSLLVAPMYVGDKNVGTISVHSGTERAFGERDKRFLTTLAAQGAMAIANAELYDTRMRRRQQLSDILEASRIFGLNQPLNILLKTIAEEVCRCSGYRMAVVNLLDEASDEVVVKAVAGVPPVAQDKLEGMRVPLDTITPLLQDDFCISRSFFIRHDRCPKIPDFDQYTFTPDLGDCKPGEWHQEDMLLVPIQTREEELLGYISVDDPSDRQMPTLDTVQALEILASVAATAVRNVRLYEVLQQELNERKRAEEVLRQRNRELELLSRAGRTFSSTLDLDQVLVTVLEEMAHLLGVVASSIWLVDPDTGELICRQATGPQRKIVRGWRLAPGEGLVGWVARNGKSLVVKDARVDKRHFKGVGDQTGLELQSILSVPMRVKQDVIGVLQMGDTEADGFKPTDLTLVESLAVTAAIAIENARLYEETDRLRAFNEDIVQNMEEGILLEGTTGHITFANPKTAELLCYTPEELIGQHWTVTAAPEEAAKIEEEAAKRPQDITSRYETVLLTKEGQRVPVIVSATPLFDKGSFTGVLSTFTDITDRKRQETRLRDYLSTVTSSLAQHTSLEGLYKFIVETGRRFLSARDCALFLVSDANGDELMLVAAVALPCGGGRSSVVGTTISAGPRCGLVAYVAHTCQPIRLLENQILQHPSWNEEIWTRLGWDFDSGHNHSFLAAAMRTPDGHLVGVLVARDAASQQGFSEFDKVLIETLATNAAADIERVKGLEKAREDAIRAERKRLETDLHEAMNVLTTGVRWEAELLSDEMERTDLAAAGIALTRLQAAFTRAYTDLRYLLEDLRDPTLEQEGLLIALRKRAELIGRGRIQVHGDFWKRLPPEVEGVLYRVGQEAMDNAVKHSGVVHNPDVKIEVWLEWSNEKVSLCVKDNGVGFDVGSTLVLSHKWGLRRLRDIVSETGGKLDIDSALGKGAMVCATIGLSGGNYGQ